MGIKVISNDIEFEITNDNVSQGKEKLEKLVTENTPIAVYESSSTDTFRNFVSGETIFYSNGKFDGNSFFSRSGKYNSVNLTNTNGYSTVSTSTSDKHEAARMVMPWNNFQTYENEGSMSHAGSTFDTYHRSGGTGLIYVGDIVEEKWPEQLKQIRFAEDSIKLDISSLYLAPPTIHNIGVDFEDSLKMSPENRLILSLTALNNIMKRASFDSDDFYNLSLTMMQIGTKSPRQMEIYENEGLPVTKEDYMLVAHNKNLGFARPNGDMNGSIYVLPREHAREFLEEAFSKERIKELYPHRID